MPWDSQNSPQSAAQTSQQKVWTPDGELTEMLVRWMCHWSTLGRTPAVCPSPCLLIIIKHYFNVANTHFIAWNHSIPKRRWTGTDLTRKLFFFKCSSFFCFAGLSWTTLLETGPTHFSVCVHKPPGNVLKYSSNKVRIQTEGSVPTMGVSSTSLQALNPKSWDEFCRPSYLRLWKNANKHIFSPTDDLLSLKDFRL